MAKPAAISNLIVLTNPLGEELDLQWANPEILPNSWQMVILKKAGAALTPTEIADYFAGASPAGITGLAVEGVDQNDPRSFADLDVLNGTRYYYAGLIQDTTTNEYSDAVSVDGTPARSISTNIVDAKAKVIEAVERVMRAYGMVRDKHYQLLREYSTQQMKPPVLYVTRAGGQVYQQYIGFFRESVKAIESYSELESDTIQVVWEDPNPVRRDIITNIFRQNKEFLRQFLMHPNGADASVVDIHIEGDVVNQAFQDRIQVGGMMLLAIVIETETQMNSTLASWYEFNMAAEN